MLTQFEKCMQLLRIVWIGVVDEPRIRENTNIQNIKLLSSSQLLHTLCIQESDSTFRLA